MTSIDVIVPCYRYGRYLRECVTSVLSQHGPAVRVLILDDASPDETAEVAASLAAEDARVTYVRHTSNRGHIATYNEGIEWVSASYMLLISADDYLLPGALHRACTLLEEHSEVGFAFGDVLHGTDAGIVARIHALPHSQHRAAFSILSGRAFLRLSLATNIVPTPTAVVRTSVQKQVGGYRPELPHSGDMEMWLRLAARGSVGYLRSCQAVYRRHSANMSRRYAEDSWLPDVRQRKMALDCFYANGGSLLARDQRLRRRAYRALACDAVSFASSAFNEGDSTGVCNLLDAALSLSPDVRMSPAWAKLACKRIIGLRAWNALRTSVMNRPTRASRQP